MKRNVKLIIAAYFVAITCVAMAVTSCSTSSHACDAYGENSISNPANAEYVEEVAFNEGIPASSVTQSTCLMKDISRA
jgi:cell division inhibitor SulA